MKSSLNIRWNGGEKTVDCENTESDVWKEVGMILPELSIPNTVEVEFNGESARLDIGKRGTFTKNGVVKPSMYVVPSYNNIDLISSEYQDAYLTCINPESNNYKFYWLRPTDAGINATYGRIGSERGEAFGVKDLQEPYDSYLYWIRFYEKLSKGYVDMTSIYLAKDKKSKKKAEKKEKQKVECTDASIELYKTLKMFAKQVVETNLVSSDVTFKQVKEVRKLINTLGQRKTVKGFNNVLSKILQLSPRKSRYINLMFASSTNDFPKIIIREDNLCTAMEALIDGEVSVSTDIDCFEKYGIEVYDATEKQVAEVKRHLADGLDLKVKKVYRVINKAHKIRFDKYLKDNNIKNVKQLWHGSINENWLSIIMNGLQLNPNARITGKMFGYGIYFAPRAKKSFGYTSCNGSYWAKGNSSRGYMGLYATAYGKPYMVTSSGHYTQSDLSSKNCNCVHATPSNTGLLNEEIVYYSEDAMLLNYIVEFES